MCRMKKEKREACCDETTDCCGHKSAKKCICTMTQPAGKFDLKKVLPLVNNPKFICSCCGRVANRKEHLCTPLPLRA
ncbi:MAG: hypothetical protein C0404_06155 [Verrucomicrobia bacterium]|nr:hypothetical protein [Verrucomicrobiota bacterium]